MSDDDAQRCADAAEDTYIEDVLGQAYANLTSLIAAMTVGDEDPAVVEAWVNTTYDQLRAGLTPEQRIRAVILLIQPDARDAAARLLDAGDVETAEVDR